MPSTARTGPWQGVVHSPLAWVFTIVLVVAFPVADYLLYFRLRSTVKIYVWNILAEWSLVAACLWLARSNGLRPADIGQQIGSPPRTVAVTGSLLAIFAALVMASKIQQRKAIRNN
jgi:hypothetical protein